MKITKSQVLVPYLGQKIVLTKLIDDGVFVYPMGSVGTLDSFQLGKDDSSIAVVIFDECPVQDCVEVDVDDLMPLEFVAGGLKKVFVSRSPSFP